MDVAAFTGFDGPESVENALGYCSRSNRPVFLMYDGLIGINGSRSASV